MHTTRPRLPRATSRTFEASVTWRECGVVTGHSVYTVTLTHTPAGILAEVNGEAAPLERAVNILQIADRVTVTAETLAVVIGKAAACELHRELGRLQFRDHYATASAALERHVVSLASLTAEEAHTVQSYARGQWSLSA